VAAARTTSPEIARVSRETLTRETICRPTREPRAPFVAGPPGPRIAAAPRVVGAAVAREGGPTTRSSCGAPESESRAREPELLVVLDRTLLPALREAFEARGGSVVLLRDEPVPKPSWSRGLDRASLVAATFGSLAAVSGALLGRGETSLPVVGWLPSSVVAAAAFAGGVATLGFALAFVLDAAFPSQLARPARVLCVVRGVFAGNEVRALGGELLALLPRAD